MWSVYKSSLQVDTLKEETKNHDHVVLKSWHILVCPETDDAKSFLYKDLRRVLSQLSNIVKQFIQTICR